MSDGLVSDYENHTQVYIFTDLLSRHGLRDWGDFGLIIFVQVSPNDLLRTHSYVYGMPIAIKFLPPASVVEVIESVSSVRVSVFPCVCVSVFLSVSEHSHG